MNAYIYIRVSTDRQAEEGYSISQQQERLTKFCEAMEWNVVDIFIDDGYTGSNMDRPALQRMLRKLDSTDLIVVDKLDRLSRSQLDALRMIDDIFPKSNVYFVSRAENLDTSTPFGRAMVGILSTFAQFERERIRERMKDGKEGRAKAGLYNGGGSVPIGYDYDVEVGTIVVNEYEAMQVREAFELYANRVPVNQIVRDFNEKGYRTKNGKWTKSYFHNIGDKVVYIGKVRHKDNIYDGVHEPIIDTETFYRVKAINDENKKTNAKYKPNMGHKSILGGMLTCQKCGMRFKSVCSVSHDKKHSYPYYVCGGRVKRECDRKRFKQEEIDQIVLNEVYKLNEETYAEDICNGKDTSQIITTLNNRIDSLDKQMSKLTELYTLDAINIDMFKQKYNPLFDEKQKLMLQIEQTKSYVPAERKNVLSAIDCIKNEKDVQTLNSMLQELIDNVVITDDDAMEIHWKI